MTEDLIKPKDLAGYLDVSPRVLCDLTDLAIGDTEHHNGKRRLYTFREAALVWIAYALSKKTRMSFQEKRETCKTLHETGEATVRLFIAYQRVDIEIKLSFATSNLHYTRLSGRPAPERW